MKGQALLCASLWLSMTNFQTTEDLCNTNRFASSLCTNLIDLSLPRVLEAWYLSLCFLFRVSIVKLSSRYTHTYAHTCSVWQNLSPSPSNSLLCWPKLFHCPCEIGAAETIRSHQPELNAITKRKDSICCGWQKPTLISIWTVQWSVNPLSNQVKIPFPPA